MTTHRYTAAKDALSFLRAAQVNQGDVEDSDLAQAFHSLKRYTERIERAERETEEQKVRDFYKVQGIIIREVDDLHVFRYNAARRFFEEQK